MIRGLYTSGWSMLVETKRLDTISNNLANVNTNAYKKDTVVLEGFPSVLTRRINDIKDVADTDNSIGYMQLGNDVGQVFTYYTQGQLAATDSKTDLAFKEDSNAFFTVAVSGADGNMKEYYTRDGSFTLDANIRLVTKEGYPVMGENGVITLQGEDFTVREDGAVIQNGEVIDRLRIRSFTDTTTLRKYGSNLVQRTPETQEQVFAGKVAQGFLEQSNVNVVREMVDMIAVMRSYEANQKIIQAQDATLEKAVNEIGSVR